MLASYGLYLVSRWMPILGRYSFTLQPFAPKQRAPEFDFTHANSPFMQSSYPEPVFFKVFFLQNSTELVAQRFHLSTSHKTKTQILLHGVGRLVFVHA